MAVLDIGNPSVKQKAFLSAKKRNVGFGGARGGGKSWAVRTKAKLLAVKHAGIRILIVRRTFPELRNNHINQLKKEIPKEIATYNNQEKEFKFANGSIIGFHYCANDGDLDFFQGVEYDVIFLDEATQLSEYQMQIITACCRGVNNFPKRIYYTCNPGGQGHAYIKRVFIDRRYEDNEDPEEFEFIQSLVQDNDALMDADPNYIKFLEGLPPKKREAWLFGKWDIFEGQFFEEFRDNPEGYMSRQWTHVIEPFDIPKGWKIYRSYDWGYAKPFSCAWWAIDFEGVLYRILELYGCTGVPNEGVKWTPQKQFAEIARVEREHPWLKGREIQGVADPACWNKETGESVMDVSSKYGVYFTKGDNKRIPGWMQVHYRLAFDENGYPMMYIFKNCKGFIRTIPTMMYSETKVEDLNTELEDHIADETRYMCMSQPIKPVKKEEPRKLSDDPLNMIADSNKNRYSRKYDYYYH